MKKLRFAEPLPGLVLSGEKNTTWRINDDKEISAGDELSLCFDDKSEFARAIVTRVNETTFQNLSDEDKERHEKFISDEEMLETYSKYYNMQVGLETEVKVIKFKLL